MADARKRTTKTTASRPADETVEMTGADGAPYQPPGEPAGGEPAPRRSQKWAPIDVDAERSVVAAVLVSPELLDELVEHLDSTDFADPVASAVYTAMLGCHTAGRPIDQITLADQLRAANKLDQVGGVDGLADLAASGISVDNVLAHAEIVADKAELRRVISAGREMASEAMKPGAEGLSSRQNAERIVFELGRERGRSSIKVLAELVPAALAEITQTRSSMLIGTSTGFGDLDRMTAGLQAGQLITVAARPGVGKSAFAMQLAKFIAETSGESVAFESYEMSAPELMNRLLAGAIRYDAMKLRQGDLAPGMDLDLARAAEKLAEIPLYIDDNPPPTIGGLRSSMRRLARRTKLGLIVVDYLQLLESERRNRGDMNRTEEVSEISRGLKRLAVELEVPVIALSQLSRALEQRPNRRPQLSDLRESGSIEQDSNSVWFLYRDHLYNGSADPTDAELILAKQRSGPTGTVHLEWHGPSATFRDRPAGWSSGGSSGGGYQYGSPPPGMPGGQRRHSETF